MTNQEEKMNVLKQNSQQQKMLNELFPVIDKALKDNFNAYAKMVQCDVANFVSAKAKKDGIVSDALTQFTTDINALVQQVGKDFEKQIFTKFEALKEATK